MWRWEGESLLLGGVTAKNKTSWVVIFFSAVQTDSGLLTLEKLESIGIGFSKIRSRQPAQEEALTAMLQCGLMIPHILAALQEFRILPSADRESRLMPAAGRANAINYCQHGDGPGDVYQKNTCPRRSRVQALPRWLPTAMLNFETLVFDNETKVPRHCLIMFQISRWHLFQNLPWAVKKTIFLGRKGSFLYLMYRYIWFIVYKPLNMGPIFTTQLLIECFLNFHRIHVWYILFVYISADFYGINVGKYSSPMHMESMFWGVRFGCVFRIEQSGEQWTKTLVV